MKKIDYYIPLFKDHLYHIYNRANGNEKIFLSAGNYYYFLCQYEKYLFESIDTFAYCLLPNHFHLLVKIKNDDPQNVSDQFRKFFISYSMAVNKQENRRGNLFQRGFKRKIIDKEAYFYSAVYYIHSNPVHHGMVDDLRKYKFSSYNSLASDKRTRLCRTEVLEWFGGRKNFIDYHSRENDVFNYNYLIEDE